MSRLWCCGVGIAILLLAGVAVDCPAAQPAATAPASGGRNAGWTTPVAPFRKLAAGVLQDVMPARSADETIERRDVTELLYVDDTFEFAKNVAFRQDVWMLEIKYKPMRMVWADIPGPNARMQRKLIYYIIYQVTNPGKVLRSAQQDDKLFKLVTEDKPVHFAPVLTLEVHDLLRKEVEGSAKAVVEQYIPVVLSEIRARERIDDLRTSTQMTLKELAVGETLWGVATWQDVDPNNVWLSVYVEGLTNAYRVTDDPAKYKAFKNRSSNEPFRELRTKVLKLNFWRPGDEFIVKETQLRNGVPELPGGPSTKPASEWVWWRTFPPAEKAVPLAK
jgi:hypothetical protein